MPGPIHMATSGGNLPGVREKGPRTAPAPLWTKGWQDGARAGVGEVEDGCPAFPLLNLIHDPLYGCVSPAGPEQ